MNNPRFRQPSHPSFVAAASPPPNDLRMLLVVMVVALGLAIVSGVVYAESNVSMTILGSILAGILAFFATTN